MSEVVYSVKMSSELGALVRSLDGGTFCPRLAQEPLLARGPDDVVVLVAVANVLERA